MSQANDHLQDSHFPTFADLPGAKGDWQKETTKN
jgi:hypothetical protein